METEKREGGHGPLYFLSFLYCRQPCVATDSVQHQVILEVTRRHLLLPPLLLRYRLCISTADKLCKSLPCPATRSLRDKPPLPSDINITRVAARRRSDLFQLVATVTRPTIGTGARHVIVNARCGMHAADSHALETPSPSAAEHSLY